MTNWTLKDIPPQAGRIAVITGATGGLGFETALALAGAGAQVVLTGRNAEKGAAALQRIRAQHPRAAIRYEHLDLASLASVAEFAERYVEAQPAIDLLINNAGVMMTPKRTTTADGFELQFGTNYLGHYALTARLLPSLRKAAQPRVVNLSSIAHRNGAIAFDDLQRQRYSPTAAYGQSKLAMLMFALELQRRSDAAGWNLLSNAAHPGFARTDLIDNGPGAGSLMANFSKLLLPIASHSAAAGALPVLYAATAPSAKKGGYYGPQGLLELKGPPGPAWINGRARDLAAASRLWDISAQLTGVQWPAPAQRSTA